ncbi:hypothetical protein ACFFMP_11145 [Pseudoroseomonas cervicalis]|uniref:Bacteriocin propeptide, TIGR03798 family n=1 Tax=Pseudoroseomonas cervicalis ATCC 49957 TaxID=525371 RepID=D5RUC9_9PROT|nr:hypothetical protein [Pseudoroseomonas cervicalis]EFH09089.1 bacteriocin propeptide, TIGR03798 family [Pseudoroseomonas cervicalis ATCC 49957]
MNAPEWQRLTRDLGEQPALRETLGAALAQCQSPEAAAALLQAHGYRLNAGDLPAPAALSDEALDGATGGAIMSVAGPNLPWSTLF